MSGGTNAHGTVICQGNFEPVLHAIALDQEGFRHQGGQGVVVKQAHREIAQVFQAVAMKNHESWLKSVGHECEAGSAGKSCLNYGLSAGSRYEPLHKNLLRTR